ncbi:MAG TPA: hypothetical protein VMA13_07565 [Candidatus Saccharimonadales bacterium]|nr:hypothetical protein [Candidatus Saccharimonadales bacterium]
MSSTNQRLKNSPVEEAILANDKDKKKKDKSEPLYSLSPELKALLNLVRLPGRLNAALTAGLLGFKPHDIPVLVARGFLQPLSDPNPNCEKYFAGVEIEELAKDMDWLSRAGAAVNQHWRLKNAGKSKPTIRVNRH